MIGLVRYGDWMALAMIQEPRDPVLEQGEKIYSYTYAYK